MTLLTAKTGLLFAAFALPWLGHAQDRPNVYKWKDQNGQWHYSATVPPEAASIDRDILNDQGVRVGSEQGEITPEERAVMQQRAAAEERERQDKLNVARRDRMLLETYLTVADIEDLRDRRLELLAAQIKVTELYLGNLRKKLLGLQAEASTFKPYNPSESAPQIPDNLALDISRTVSSINLYEQALARSRSDQDALRDSFDEDIVRFKELKGG